VAAELSYAARSLQVLIWAGGAASTVAGSWIASKIRVYDDDKKSHHQDLKDRVLCPLRDLLAQNEALFSHRAPVLLEKVDYSKIVDALPDQDDVRAGLVLHRNDPWPYVWSQMDRALFEDAKRTHYKNLLTEILALASSWESHTEHCEIWVAEISEDILANSQMNPYAPPYAPPWINHLRIGLWIYRRLFHLPTEALRQTNQGKYWSIEGAPTVPDQIGNATLANAEQNNVLLQKIAEITAANRVRAAELLFKSQAIADRVVVLRSKLEYEIAKKKLRSRCDLVKFF